MSDANWHLLRIFAVIVEQRGVTRAAESLGLSQPAVSQSLQKLEAALGHPLIRRGSRDFEMTAMGEAVHAEVAAMNRAAESITRLTGQGRDELLVRVVSNLVLPLIDEAFRLFHQRHPEIAFRVEVLRSHAVITALRDSGRGIGICLLARPLEDLDCRLIHEEEWSLYCGVEHPFFGRPQVTLEELRPEPFVSFACAAEGPGLESMVPLSRHFGLGGTISGVSAHVEEVRRMIIAGVGLGVLPISAGRAAQQAGQLWPLRVSDQPLRTHVYLVSPRHHGDQAAAAFAALIDEILPLFRPAPA